MLVYVAGKYTADSYDEKEEYVSVATEVAKEILKKGFIPIIPHKITFDWEYDYRFEDWNSDDWLEKYCFPLLESCDVLVVSCGLENSYGVKKEIEFALNLGIPVFYSLEEFLETYE